MGISTDSVSVALVLVSAWGAGGRRDPRAGLRRSGNCRPCNRVPGQPALPVPQLTFLTVINPAHQQLADPRGMSDCQTLLPPLGKRSAGCT